MKQIKNLMKHEAQYEKERGTGNFNVLSKKLVIKPDNNNAEKKEKHLQ